MQLVFLGTGGSWPSPERNVSAVALKRGKEVILFDCGEGTQRQLMQSSVSFMQITRIFISHFHGDHFLGLPGLIQSMGLNNREAELHIYGPGGMEDLLDDILNMGHFTAGYQIIGHDVKEGQTLEFDEYSVEIAEADHTVPAIAFSLTEKPRPGKFNKPRALELGIPEGPLFRKLQEGQIVEHGGKTFTPDMVMGPPRPGRKITYSGDTRPSAVVEALAGGSDVLIHEATTESSLEEKANEYGHSSARQAANLAKNAGVSTLFLFHISPRYDETEVIQTEARSIFPETYVAEDFQEYEVKFTV